MMFNTSSLIGRSDSYKMSHWRMYPKSMTNLYSYFECRKPSSFSNEVVFFGLQQLLMELELQYITEEEVNRWNLIASAHFGRDDIFNYDGWMYIVREHGGKLPIKVRAIPEGSVVPVGTPLFTVESTDPKCAWLVGYLETWFVQIWYPITVATLSFSIRKMLQEFAIKCGCPNIDFMLHDFGCRGVSSMESASIGGAAHLLSFNGTDTLPALDYIYYYYARDHGEMQDKEFYTENIQGFSIPATEHSIMTCQGKDRETQVCRELLEEFPEGLLAIVSDSYDIFNLVENVWGTELQSEILNRNGTLVIRPDSGDPCAVLTQIFHILETQFGYSLNSKGYKVLPPQIRVIWGDGLNFDTIKKICENLLELNWSIENIAFGMGGGLLQKVNRDTFSCAYKASSAIIDNKETRIFKQPITDSGKESKSGRFHANMQIVFQDGKVTKDWHFKEIKTNVRSNCLSFCK